MKNLLSRHLVLLLWLAALSLIGASCVVLFKAGCAGDLKGGSLGSVEEALRLEEAGVPFAWAGVAIAVLAIACHGRLSAQQRIAGAVVVFLVGAIGSTFLGIQFEVWGVQACLSSVQRGAQ